jgi:hypothetical protein
MAKVVKAYSLDIRTIEILEQYCQEHDNWDKTWSRSKVVNDAICWFLEGDTAELVASQEALMSKVRELAMKNTLDPSNPPSKTVKSWWRILLRI